MSKFFLLDCSLPLEEEGQPPALSLLLSRFWKSHCLFYPKQAPFCFELFKKILFHTLVSQMLYVTNDKGSTKKSQKTNDGTEDMSDDVRPIKPNLEKDFRWLCCSSRWLRNIYTFHLSSVNEKRWTQRLRKRRNILIFLNELMTIYFQIKSWDENLGSSLCRYLCMLIKSL